MIDFYCIDGPLKDQQIKSDFHPTTTSIGVIYYKHTFAKKIDNMVLYTDIASINPNLSELEITEQIPFFIRTEKLIIFPIKPNGEAVS